MATDAPATSEAAVLHDLLNRLTNVEAIAATLNIESNRLAAVTGNIQSDFNRIRDSHMVINSSQMELNGKIEALTTVVTNSRGGGGGH